MLFVIYRLVDVVITSSGMLINGYAPFATPTTPTLQGFTFAPEAVGGYVQAGAGNSSTSVYPVSYGVSLRSLTMLSDVCGGWYTSF